jgi:cytochrome P450
LFRALLDALLVGSFQGRPLTDQEVLSTLSILLFGAVDTTANAVAGAMYYFAGRPRDQARFRETGFDMIALDEIVRWTSPVQGIGRILKKDTEVAGCPMKAGEWVHLSFGSGNYDDTVFPDPETMDFERKPNPHLGFGMGPHRCVGAHLGKLMLKVALEELLRRLGPVRLGDPAEIQWVGGETRGLRRLPLVRG